MAAVQRAVEKLNASALYAGEVWSLGDESLPGYGPAQVEITVTATDPEAPNERRVRTRVVFPVDAVVPIRRTAELSYSIRNSPDSRKEP